VEPKYSKKRNHWKPTKHNAKNPCNYPCFNVVDDMSSM
jgi:hypothetical protein